MLPIYRREVRAVFTGMMGYVFIAALVAISGVYTMVICLHNGYANISYVLSSTSFLFIVAIPLLTMRSVSEDRKQKTDQLLYSLPMSTWKIILGKYLACLTVFAAAVAILCLIPPVLGQYGTVSYAASYTALLGYFFLGASLIAIGVFVSSLTENQVIAGVLSFGATLLLYIASSLASYLSNTAFTSLCAICALSVLFGVLLDHLTKNYFFSVLVTAALCLAAGIVYFIKNTLFEGLFPKMLESLSVFDRFNSFTNGTLDLTALFYDLTLIGLFLLFAVQSMEKRRWSE